MNATPPNLPRDAPREFIADNHPAAANQLDQRWPTQPAIFGHRGASFPVVVMRWLAVLIEN